MRRTAILRDEKDNVLGRTTVAEATHLIAYNEEFYIRTDKGVRLPGGGIGVVFDHVDPAIRMKLERI